MMIIQGTRHGKHRTTRVFYTSKVDYFQYMDYSRCLQYCQCHDCVYCFLCYPQPVHTSHYSLHMCAQHRTIHLYLAGSIINRATSSSGCCRTKAGCRLCCRKLFLALLWRSCKCRTNRIKQTLTITVTLNFLSVDD